MTMVVDVVLIGAHGPGLETSATRDRRRAHRSCRIRGLGTAVVGVAVVEVTVDVTVVTLGPVTCYVHGGRRRGARAASGININFSCKGGFGLKARRSCSCSGCCCGGGGGCGCGCGGFCLRHGSRDCSSVNSRGIYRRRCTDVGCRRMPTRACGAGVQRRRESCSHYRNCRSCWCFNMCIVERLQHRGRRCWTRPLRRMC